MNSKVKFDQGVVRIAEHTREYLAPMLRASEKVLAQGMVVQSSNGLLADNRGDLIPGWAFVTSERMIYDFDVVVDRGEPAILPLGDWTVGTQPWTAYKRISQIDWEFVVLINEDVHMFLVVKGSNIPFVLKRWYDLVPDAARQSDGMEPSSRTLTSLFQASDIVGQLERLGELYSSGVLTESEFEAAKARLLGHL